MSITLSVANNGPSNATGVSLSNILPLGVSATDVDSTQGSCTLSVTCSLGTIEPGETVVVTITADVGLGLLGSLLNLNASATSGTSDPNMSNNSDLINITI